MREVLGEYLSGHPCLCGWPQFRFWAGKEHGPGWMDEIQNRLVADALDLPLFRREPPAAPSYMQGDDAVCTACGTRWRHFEFEWRMQAFQQRLIAPGTLPSECAAFDPKLTGEWIFATAGCGPQAGDPVLALGEWVSFMLGRPFRAVPRPPGAIP
ncbi:MAG: hypothetical protein QUS11_00930 [Candidatus Fermentibacter sp.]|nr:hypothetical protein [Candidatus Fermentibacter sp.]